MATKALPVTRTALENAAKTLSAAMFVSSDKSDLTKKEFALPNEDLGILTEMLNTSNPFSAYDGVTISGQGSASVEVKYDVYNDNWKLKTDTGSDTTGGDDVVITDEIFKWNKPYTKEEKMGAYDLKRGAPVVLPQRMSTASVKFLQNSIKRAFGQLVSETAGATGNGGKGSAVQVEKLEITSRDLIAKSKIEIIQAITAFAVANEIDPGDLVVTLAPTIFDALSENGMIGDRSTVTFAGGQYSVGMLGGYAVQSGGMYIPAVGTVGTDTDVPVYAFVGTSQVALHSVDFTAANAGKLGLSNDQGTFLEMGDISGVLDYQGNFGKSQGLVIFGTK